MYKMLPNMRIAYSVAQVIYSRASSYHSKLSSHFQVGGSVGVRVIGGNQVGIFVSAVAGDSPAALHGVCCGDRILEVRRRLSSHSISHPLTFSGEWPIDARSDEGGSSAVAAEFGGQNQSATAS